MNLIAFKVKNDAMHGQWWWKDICFYMFKKTNSIIKYAAQHQILVWEECSSCKAYKRAMDDLIAGTDQSAQMFATKVMGVFAVYTPANYTTGTYKDYSRDSIMQQLGKNQVGGAKVQCFSSNCIFVTAIGCNWRTKN